MCKYKYKSTLRRPEPEVHDCGAITSYFRATNKKSRVLAQAIPRRVLIPVGRVQSQGSPRRFCGRWSGFLLELRFSLATYHTRQYSRTYTVGKWEVSAPSATPLQQEVTVPHAVISKRPLSN
jgi:hypothetical protein